MGLNCVMARAKRASLLLLRMVHFILTKVLVMIGRCGWKKKTDEEEQWIVK